MTTLANVERGIVDEPAVSSFCEYRGLPKSFRDKNRLERQLIAFYVASVGRLSGLPKHAKLAPYVDEVHQVLELLSSVSGAPSSPAASGNAGGAEGSPSRPASVLSSGGVASIKSRQNVSHAVSQRRATSPTASSAAPDAVRYLAAACREPPGRSLELLDRAHKEGSLVAGIELGVCLTFGIGCAPAPGVGLDLLDGGVSVGHPGAVHAVSLVLRDGIGVAADAAASRVWLLRAAEMDYVLAQHDLGEMYENGDPLIGGEKSLPLAFRWYKRAADLGYDESQLNLGKVLLLGSKVDVGCVVSLDPAVVPAWNELRMKALFWLHEAASRGNIEARQLVERTTTDADAGA